MFFRNVWLFQSYRTLQLRITVVRSSKRNYCLTFLTVHTVGTHLQILHDVWNKIMDNKKVTSSFRDQPSVRSEMKPPT
jgi:hypothetical protein